MPIRPFGRDKQHGSRAAFRPPPEFDILTSLWVNVKATDDGTRFTLQFDYPDFTPAVGWKLDCNGKTYVVNAVDGRNLDATEEGGEP